MPWAMISSGVTESYLWRERERAYASVTTPDCRTHCPSAVQRDVRGFGMRQTVPSAPTW